MFVDVGAVGGDEVGDVAAVAVVVVGVDGDVCLFFENVGEGASGLLAFLCVDFHGVDAAEAEGDVDSDVEMEIKAHFHGVTIDEVEQLSGVAVPFAGLDGDDTEFSG